MLWSAKGREVQGRLLWRIGALVMVLLLGQAEVGHAQKVREGFLLHQQPEGEILYFFRAIEDSVVYIREGVEEEGPALSLPPLVVRSLNDELNKLAPIDSSEVERFELSYEDNKLFLSLAQRVDLLFYALVLLGGVWVVLLFVFRRKLQRVNRKQHTLAESRHRLADDREDERRRLARELHDGPVQDLHALRMSLNLLLSQQGAGYDDVEADLLHVIRELRAISEDLRPPALVPFGLGAALQAHIERFEKRHPEVSISHSIAQDRQRLPERVRLALFRICQETLNNTVQHAHATHVAVRFALEEDGLILEVRDNGNGFTVPEDWVKLAAEGHYGLLGMSERAEAIGATFEVRSAPDTGTLVHVTLELKSASSQEPVPEEEVPS